MLEILQEKQNDFTLAVKRIIGNEMSQLLMKTIKGLN